MGFHLDLIIIQPSGPFREMLWLAWNETQPGGELFQKQKAKHAKGNDTNHTVLFKER